MTIPIAKIMATREMIFDTMSRHHANNLLYFKQIPIQGCLLFVSGVELKRLGGHDHDHSHDHGHHAHDHHEDAGESRAGRLIDVSIIFYN